MMIENEQMSVQEFPANATMMDLIEAQDELTIGSQ